MPLRKLDDPKEEKPCFNPVHEPPGHISLGPGRWEYECPGCGKKTIFTVLERMMG